MPRVAPPAVPGRAAPKSLPPIIDPIIAVVLEKRTPKPAAEEAAEEAARLAQKGPETSQDEFGPHRDLAAPPDAAAPTVYEVEHLVRVYERRTARAVAEVRLHKGERLLSICCMPLPTGPRGPPQSVVVLGTGYSFPRGEDELPQARLLPVAVGRELGVEGLPNGGVKVAVMRIETMYERGLTAIAPLVTPRARYAVVATGQRLMLMRWEGSHFAMAGFRDTRFWVTSLSVARTHIVAGDVTGSIRLLQWRDETQELSPLAADERPLPVLATATLGRGGQPGIAAATADGDIVLFETSRSHGRRLVAGGGLHLGAPAPVLVRLKLHLTDDATGGALPPSSKEAPRFAVLACDTDGGIGVVSGADPAAHTAAHAAAAVAAAVLPCPAGLDPLRASSARVRGRPGGLVSDLPTGGAPRHTLRASGPLGRLVSGGDRRLVRDVALAAGSDPAGVVAVVAALARADAAV